MGSRRLSYGGLTPTARRWELQTINPRRWIVRSLAHHWRMHVSVALAVAVATAVLTGALVVGDSMRTSLRELALDGLGRVHFALRPPRLYRESLALDISAVANAELDEPERFRTVPAILLEGSLQTVGKSIHRAGGVSIIGCCEEFWSFGEGGPESPLVGPVVALTQSLADELKVAAGADVLLRVQPATSLPGESLLGSKDGAVVSRRLRVAAVLQPEGIARFSLSPSQHRPRNAFVSLDVLQELLDAPEKINAILVGRPSSSQRDQILESSGVGTRDAERLADALQDALQPEDYGIRVERVTIDQNADRRPEFSQAIDDPNLPRREKRGSIDYIDISSDQLVLPPYVVKRITPELDSAGLQPVITYLANTVAVGDRKIPYSTISGVDSTELLGPLADEDGAPILLTDEEIVLNDWAAEQLDAKIGDRVTIRFYEPESTHGQLREHAPVTLTLKAIVPLITPNGKPTRAADPRLTPELDGVTDQESIRDWEVPFPLVETIRPADEAYWDMHSTTPKAFVSRSLAERLWSSRFGVVTSLRGKRVSPKTIKQSMRAALEPGKLGFAFQPVRAQALAAASGTTPFGLLFLGFSMFLIASGVMLIALLFRLSVHLRASEIGVLAALGVPGRRVRQMLLQEATTVAAIGAALGVLGGVGYAWLMLAGLSSKTLWLKAIVTPFLSLHASAGTLLFGWVLGIAAAFVPCWIAIRSVARVPPRRLLSGETTDAGVAARVTSRWSLSIPLVLVLAAIALGLFGSGRTGETQALAFFAAGALVLAAALLLLRRSMAQLIAPQPGDASAQQDRHWTYPLLQLATRSAARNPGRSLLCIGLVAAASFLIVAISAFRLGTSDEGAGGFDLLAESDVPIQFDLATSDGRDELGFSDEENKRLDRTAIFGVRVREGDDASCLNLYKPRQPRLLGVPASFIERGGFGWAATAEEVSIPWSLLDRPLKRRTDGTVVVPVVLDADTANFSLKVGLGDCIPVDDAAAGRVELEVVGLLKKSLLQGVLLLSEANFLQLYPQSDGYRFFLADCLDDQAEDVATVLESTLEDFGFDVVPTSTRLSELYAVQNTYLSTFQSLGGIGLLLGTIGLAAVQVRSVIERRGEFALLRAVGFRRRRLLGMVLAEDGVLLLVGLGTGCFAACVSLLPHWIAGAATLPWIGLAAMLVAIAAIGLMAGGVAAQIAVRSPVLPALRGD